MELCLPFLDYPSLVKIFCTCRSCKLKSQLTNALRVLKIVNEPTINLKLVRAILQSSIGSTYIKEINLEFSKIKESLLEDFPKKVESVNLNGCR